MYGLSASRTLPTTWVHMWSVARVGSQASSGSAGQCGFCSVILGLLSLVSSSAESRGDAGSSSRTRQPAKGCDKAVDVVLVVIHVRADAHAADAGRDVDALRRKPFDQASRHAGWKMQTEDMRGPHRGIGNRHTAVAQLIRETRREHAQPSLDRVAAPLRHHLHSDRRHFQRDEMVALAHIEAPRAGDEFGIAIIALPLRGDGAAAIAGLLQRHAT